MTAFRCPHCQRALTTDDAVEGSCPWCGGVVADAALPATVPPEPSPLPPPDMDITQPRWLLGGCLIALLVLLAVGVTILSLTNAAKPLAKETAKDTGSHLLAQAATAKTHRAAPVQTKQSAAQQPQEKPTAVVSAKDKEPGQKEPKQPKEPAVQPEPKPEPKLEPKPEPKKEGPPAKAPEVVENGSDRKVYLPEGTYNITALNRSKLKLRGTVKTLKVDLADNESELDVSLLELQEIVFERVANRSKIKLKGKAGTLRVNQLENESEVDASALEVERAIFGRIAHRCKVKVNAPGGTIECRGQVENACTLLLLAPNGKVTFADRIDTDTKVNVTAKKVDFRGIIAGNQTQALVTLTPGGELQFREVAGSARLEYRKANAADPAPIVQAGTVGNRAKFGLVQ